MFRAFTLGIEEEYMVMDPTTRELRSHEQKIVEQAHKVIRDQVKAEFHQAVVEVGTQICANIQEAREDVALLRRTITQIAGDLGHPARAGSARRPGGRADQRGPHHVPRAVLGSGHQDARVGQRGGQPAGELLGVTHGRLLWSAGARPLCRAAGAAA